jgi:hypothetical protein
MTYLQAVNKVLIRLREDEVSSVSETAYSKLIGEFVNDALRQVEDAWDWSALRTTLTATTQEDVFSYVLTGSGNRGKVLDVVNDTANFFMEYRAQNWFNNTYLNQNPISGKPRYYTYNGVDSNGDTQVDVYPKPDGVYDLRFNMVLRNKELTNDSDKILVPYNPVVHLAVALAARERGETGGQSVMEYLAISERALSDAIALDAQKHPEETIFYMG